jgi:hypothetical protein
LSAGPDDVTYAQLRTAASFDPVAFRAFWKIMGMIVPAATIYTDPEVAFHTRAALARHGCEPYITQPTREQLLAALAS